ncbi:hypothetical protein ACFLTP_09980 [Chloroflexota bacterium]
METPVKRTPMPMIAGILCVFDGGFTLLALLGLIIASFFAIASPKPNYGLSEATILLLIGIVLVILGVLAVVGGIYALRRKNFGMALTGSIAAFLPFSLLGLASIILIALSKDEFE